MRVNTCPQRSVKQQALVAPKVIYKSTRTGRVLSAPPKNSVFMGGKSWLNLFGMKQPIEVTSEIRLKDFDPAFCNGLEKEATRVETTKLCQRIGELEELLNANAKHSIIILLQGRHRAARVGIRRPSRRADLEFQIAVTRGIGA